MQLLYATIVLLTIISLLCAGAHASPSSSPSLIVDYDFSVGLPVAYSVGLSTEDGSTDMWFSGVAPSIAINDKLFTNQEDGLKLTDFNSDIGENELGFYKVVNFEYSIEDETSSTPWINTITTYQDYNNIAIFTQSFPQGAKNTQTIYGNVSYAIDAPSEFNSSIAVIGQWPCFNLLNGSIADNAYLFWGGRFAVLSTGNTLYNLTYPGIEGGPIVFYDQYFNTIVFSPLDNFKTSMLSVVSNNPSISTLSGGISANVTSLPENFTTSYILFYGVGITETLKEWGEFLVEFYSDNELGLKVETDVATNFLGYWTDNGAYYFADNWGKQTPEEIIIALNKSFAEQNIPVQYYQLDAWWYPTGNYGCIQDWVPMENQFPDGFKYLTEKISKTLLLYSNLWCADNVYSSNWTFWPSYWYTAMGGGDFAVVSSDDAFGFYSHILGEGAAVGMTNFEVDFMDFSFLLTPQFQSNVSAAADWLTGMAEALAYREIPMQYCMPMPNDLLQSINYAWVTNTRASNDYALGAENWYYFPTTSLYYWALGMAPSKDTFWTTSYQRGNPYGRGYNEPNPEMVTILAAFSTGPVGFSDKINSTNFDIIIQTCTSGGRLLQPSKPFTPIDATFSYGSRALVNGMALTSYTMIGDYLWSYLLAISVQQDFFLQSDDFYPTWSPAVQYVFLQKPMGWLPEGACVHESNALENCLSGFADTLLNIHTPTHDNNGTENFTLIYFIPIDATGYALIGELDKYVPVSPDRFTSISFSSQGVDVSLAGTPGEVVNVWAMTPNFQLRVASLTIPDEGKVRSLLT